MSNNYADLEAKFNALTEENEALKADIETFEVKDYDLESGDEINILWMSDEQSWNMKEMQTFHNAFNKIINEWEIDENGNSTFDSTKIEP